MSGSKTRRQSTPLTTEGSAHGSTRIASTIPRPGNRRRSVTATRIAEHQLERDGQHHVLDGVADGPDRRRVVEHLAVVAQADVALRLAVLPRGLDALLEAPDERVDDQAADRSERRGDHEQADGGRLVGAQPGLHPASSSTLGAGLCGRVRGGLGRELRERVGDAHLALDRRVEEALGVRAELRVPDGRALREERLDELELLRQHVAAGELPARRPAA